MAGLCSWLGWSPPPLPWARQKVMLLGGRVALSPGKSEGMEKASPWSPTSAGLQSLPGGLQLSSACPARAAGSLAGMGHTELAALPTFAHLALSDTQPWRVSDPHRGGRMDKTDPTSLCPSLAVIRLGVKIFLIGSSCFLFFN